jgi:hypothetical protein
MKKRTVVIVFGADQRLWQPEPDPTRLSETSKRRRRTAVVELTKTQQLVTKGAVQ